ncbi:MAG: ABC transporter ATP-binding protein [Ilumatobacteraceae bacterium]|nr:ABC transporter ATP-binding protein [Ilumatobacteraceae bacterium]
MPHQSAVNAISVSGLTKQFGSLTAVDDLTVDIPTGGVVGLLGPNGSGKSTTIRMLLGLITPTSGTATVLGHPISDPAAFLPRVGALIESPTMYPKLSAERNLRSLARLAGVSDGRVAEVLDIVGLTGRERDPFGDYSLGMKQRLGIAAALLRDPELLVLDEPTNGLDPAGIVEIRDLLVGLGRQGRTVVVSSHLLAEIQAACDRLVIIQRGRLVFEGPMRELLDHTTDAIHLEPEHPGERDHLAEILTAVDVQSSPDGAGLVVDGSHEPASLNRLAADAGIVLQELHREREDLEDVFLRLTASAS